MNPRTEGYVLFKDGQQMSGLHDSKIGVVGEVMGSPGNAAIAHFTASYSLDQGVREVVECSDGYQIEWVRNAP